MAKGQRKIYVTADNGDEKEYSVPRGIHVNVQEGERLSAGDPLMDGPLNPHDILAVLGEKALQAYLVNEIQEVYRLQGVAISDKHIEVIVRQMLRWVRIDEVGDTSFLLEQQVDRFRFTEENERVLNAGGRPAIGRPLLLGITKASLSTDSFISAASFQETTRVLTEASINGAARCREAASRRVVSGRSRADMTWGRCGDSGRPTGVRKLLLVRSYLTRSSAAVPALSGRDQMSRDGSRRGVSCRRDQPRRVGT